MTVEKVVYIIGAGFSAPLGLPVVRNFIERSKDLYLSDQGRYRDFYNVFQQIQKLSNVKNYYSADLFDIEEVLSILDLNAFISGTGLKKEFEEYVKTVISDTTPQFVPQNRNLLSTGREVFKDERLNKYAFFVLSLFNVVPRYSIPDAKRIIPNVIRTNVEASYDVISLNYDEILEKLSGHFLYNDRPMQFRMPGESIPEGHPIPLLAKLHGSVTSEIVPPTWRKGSKDSIVKAWEAAVHALRSAHHIRILGYSLPVADAYVRYLLKAAAAESEYLKRIDVICLDNKSGDVERRYRDSVTFNNFRFRSLRIEDYLDPFIFVPGGRAHSGTYPNMAQRIQGANLEGIHEQYMEKGSFTLQNHIIAPV